METRVTDREVTEHFAEIIERVNRSGETLIVVRDGEAVLRIGPGKTKLATGKDLRRLFELFPPDPGFARDVQLSIDAQAVEIPRSPWD
jgi:antitoxin (DNA-binding transcriptional repressor) of toxin-antitoxin stability system